MRSSNAMGDKVWLGSELHRNGYLSSNLPSFKHDVSWLVQWRPSDEYYMGRRKLLRVEARSPVSAFRKFVEKIGLSTGGIDTRFVHVILPDKAKLESDLERLVAARKELGRDRDMSYHSLADVVSVLRGEDVELPETNWNREKETKWLRMRQEEDVLSETLAAMSNERGEAMVEKVTFGEMATETKDVRRTIEVFYDGKLIGHLISSASIYDSKFDAFKFFPVDEGDEFGKSEIDISMGEKVEEALGDFSCHWLDDMQEKVEEVIATMRGIQHE